MPGLAGILALAPHASIHGQLDRMLTAMTGYQPIIGKLEPGEAGCSMGLASRCTLPLQRADHFVDTEHVSLIVDGEFYTVDDRSLDEAGQIEVAGMLAKARQADELAGLLARIDGIFSFALYQKQPGRLFIGVDAFGLKPLYFARDENNVSFAAEVKSIAATLTTPPGLDIDLACEVLCFGYPLTQATLVEGVRRVPPATLFAFDRQSGTQLETRYWAVESLFLNQPDGAGTISKTDLTDAFGRAVLRRSSESDKICVPISGGLDSRAITAAYAEHARGLHSYTLARRESLERKAATAIAEIAGVVSHVIDITRDVDVPGRKMAELDILPSDGQKPPAGWFTHLYEEYSQNSGTEILVVGLGAEVAKLSIVSPVKLNKANEGICNREQALRYFGNSLCRGDLWGTRLKSIFTAAFAERLKTVRDASLRHLFRNMPDDTPMIDMMGFWYLHGYLSQGAAFGLMNRRPYYELRFPYADRHLLELLMRADPEWRKDATLQLESIARFSPAMMKVKNCNTGIPLSAGPLTSFTIRASQKLKSALASRGVQHSPQQWRDDIQRNKVRELIVSTLGGDAFLSKGIVDPDRFPKALSDYMSGDDNGLSSVLPKMLSVEIADQCFKQAHSPLRS